MSSHVTPVSFDDVARSERRQFFDAMGTAVSIALIIGAIIHTHAWVQILLGWA